MKHMIKLSDRLQQIANLLPQGIRFADIGSDHAYLPSHVCLNDSQAKAIAGEVKKGPYESARQTVEHFELNNVEVRYGNGLEILAPGEVDTIVIAGMGGSLIASILQKGQAQLEGVTRLILQPNNEAITIRQSLGMLGFDIVDEMIIKDQGYFYELLVASPVSSPKSLGEKEQMFGPVLLNKKTDAFNEKWQQEYSKLQKIITQMQSANQVDAIKINAFKHKMNLIKEVLDID